MERKPPPPLAESFLICREIFQDLQTGEHILLGPRTGAAFPGFPTAMRLSLFFRLKGGHGTYKLSLLLRNAEGDAVGKCDAPAPWTQTDPLATCQGCWRDLVIQFPRPGMYDFFLQANGEDLSHHSFSVALKANS